MLELMFPFIVIIVLLGTIAAAIVSIIQTNRTKRHQEEIKLKKYELDLKYQSTETKAEKKGVS